MALLRLLQQLEDEQVVDVFNTVYILRLHRPLMIQTLVRAPGIGLGSLDPKEWKMMSRWPYESRKRRSWGHSEGHGVTVTPRLPSHPDCHLPLCKRRGGTGP